MSRRPRTTLSPSLFPFLAVLVCTMGTLILLLAMLSQKARESAEELVETHTESTRLAAEEQRWQAEQLVAYRDQQTAELEQKRTELAHLEDHLRRLRDSLSQLRTEAETAEQGADEEATVKAGQRLASLQMRIEREKELIEHLREAEKKRPPRVIIVPYRGSNGTDRRPIYVECTDRAVIIQPEGVRITPTQLDGPLGPGNPLDAALRTVRTHWQELDPDAPPPYPLLLVRPGGIHAYGACRSAMTAWDDQFGYELVPADLDLAYPKPDASLAPKLVASIETAAMRQQARVAAAPRRYGGVPAGVVPHKPGIAAAGPGRMDADGSGRGATGGVAAGDSLGLGNDSALAAGGRADMASRSGSGLGNGDSIGDSVPDGTRRGPSLRPPGLSTTTATGKGSSPEGDTFGGESAEFAGDGKTEGDSAAQASSIAAAGDGTSNPLESSGGTLSSGQMSAGGGTAAAGPAAPTGQTTMSTVASPGSGASPMQSTPPPDPHEKTFSEIADTSPPPSSSNGAKSRSNPGGVLRAGNNWAMPDTVLNRRGVNIVRQMRLHCDATGFVLMPEGKSGDVPTAFPIRDGLVDDAIMELAAAMKERIADWGTAMQNGRWEPVLVVTVAPGAEARFDQLAVLLRDSGIRVEKSKP